MEHIGIIYGNVGTTEFECQINANVEKNDYIRVNHQTIGPVLGQVDSIERRTDLSLEKAQKIANGEPVEIDEKVTAKISIVGFRDDRNLLQVPRTPFKAGEFIYKAEDELIREIIGLKEDKEGGAYVGLLSGHDIRVYVDINSLVQKHMSVLAKTGGGKSYVTGVVIEELMKHNVTTVILDPHGEYSSMKEPGKDMITSRNFRVSPKGYASRIMEFASDTKLNKDAKPLRFTLSNLTARNILELTNTKNAKTYLAPLRKAIDFLRANKGDYNIEDIIRVLEMDEETPMGGLVGELEYLREVDIFAERGTKMEELIKKGKTTVINLKGSPPDIQALIVNRISTYLFELRKQDKIPPLMMVAEEAHNFCPQQGQVASSKIFRTIASEGRKFGLGICIVTQRPAKVDKNVLSQCNTQVILKVTNPNDLKAITASVEGLTTGMTDEIQRLPIGTAIITGGKITMPLFVEIRPRETKHGGESVTIVERSGEKGLAY
ncbi:MAG: ATP-binding protein [Thermoplasmata archaeon]|nr:MAG: ATP-binding protein [Thermoplasmata archaeon]